jgi:tape measure domain-containing protein
MATIRTAIQIQDGMTPAMRSMTNALNICISSFEAMQNASSRSVDTASIAAARAELNKASMAMDSVEKNIREADVAQQQLNNQMRNGQSAAEGLVNKVKQMATGIAAAFGIKQIIELSDAFTQTTARLGLMNDGMQTTAQLQDMVFQSAQRSRTPYLDTAAAVSKLGLLAKDAFSNNSEIITFAEQMNKQFKIGGASIQEQTAGMYQLTQAMASGRLQGDEFRSIRENAPMLAQAIKQYMENIGVKGTLKDWSKEGLITADVIKNAMFAVADETNKKFAELPMTWGQVWTVIQNGLFQTFQPLIQIIGAGAQWIYDNWSTLEPIFWGLVAAVGAYTVITGIQTAATWLSVAANRALIVTMLSNPILWITLAIGVLIGAIYKWAQSVGGIEIAWKMAMDRILTAWDWVKIGFFTGIYWVLNLWDKLKIGVMSASVVIQNFMGDMKTGVLVILQNMVNGAIGIINDFINILNKIPGVSIDVIQNATFGATAQMENDAAKRARETSLQNYRAKLEVGMATRDAALLQMKTDARSATAQRQVEINAAQAEVDKTTQENVSNIAGNTKDIKDSLDISTEDLKYLRDIAEQEVINRFTTAEIKVDMTNYNSVNNEMDLDGMTTYLKDRLETDMQSAAEGVHD